MIGIVPSAWFLDKVPHYYSRFPARCDAHILQGAHHSFVGAQVAFACSMANGCFGSKAASTPSRLKIGYLGYLRAGCRPNAAGTEELAPC